MPNRGLLRRNRLFTGSSMAASMGARNNLARRCVSAAAITSLHISASHGAIDVAQTAATHVIENFGSGDLLDLGTLNMTGTLDLTVYTSATSAQTAISGAALGSEVSVALHDNGTDIDLYIDTNNTGAYDMIITIDSISSISASQIDL